MTNAQNVNFADIEARARQMRAEAARDGFVAMRRIISDLLSALPLMGGKTA